MQLIQNVKRTLNVLKRATMTPSQSYKQNSTETIDLDDTEAASSAPKRSRVAENPPQIIASLATLQKVAINPRTCDLSSNGAKVLLLMSRGDYKIIEFNFIDGQPMQLADIVKVPSNRQNAKLWCMWTKDPAFEFCAVVKFGGQQSENQTIHMWQRAESVQAKIRKREEVEVVQKMLPGKFAGEMTIRKVEKDEPIQTV